MGKCKRNFPDRSLKRKEKLGYGPVKNSHRSAIACLGLKRREEPHNLVFNSYFLELLLPAVTRISPQNPRPGI